jgi:hypothetical protein
MIFRKLLTLSIASCLGALFARTAWAEGQLSAGQGFWRSTYLVEAAQQTALSGKARVLQAGGFETARGEWVAFDGWYTSPWKDTRWSWMTQINPHWGLIWGISTGERGRKYTIEPGLRLGFLFQTELGKDSRISLGWSGTLGGRLKERTCTADYGDVGGVQTVNCRLAASVLSPAATLAFVLNERPDQVGHIQYQYFFD